MQRSLPVVEVGESPPDPLVRGGWQRRFIAVGPRLDEAVALYEHLGFLVSLQPVNPEELREECGDCHVALRLYRVLYTRRPR